MESVQITLAVLSVNVLLDTLEMDSHVKVKLPSKQFHRTWHVNSNPSNFQTFLDKKYYSNPIAFLSTQSMREYRILWKWIHM
jgi:vacuolar-type H+-ATPase subunit C/Vma6